MANYELSNRIYELRKQKNLSQKELGALLGVSNKAVSKWETGTAIPKTETLIKLAEVFEISPEELLNFVREETKLTTLADLSVHTQRVLEQKNIDERKERTNVISVKSSKLYLVGLVAVTITSLIFAIAFVIMVPDMVGFYGDLLIQSDNNVVMVTLTPILAAGTYTGVFGFFKLAKKMPAWVCVLCGILFLFLFMIIVLVGTIMIIPFSVKAYKTIKNAKVISNE